MSHQVPLSPAASHCPTAVLDPAGHATDPPACRSRCPYSPGRTCAGYCPTLEIRSARPSLTPPPKIPGRARDRHGRTRPCRSATVRWQADSREEGSGARTPRATGAPHYVLGHPGSDLLARLVAAVDLRATPRGTCHRPPVDRLRHQAQASPNDHVGASDSAESSAYPAAHDNAGRRIDSHDRLADLRTRNFAQRLGRKLSARPADSERVGSWLISRGVSGQIHRFWAFPPFPLSLAGRFGDGWRWPGGWRRDGLPAFCPGGTIPGHCGG
jgi:hypothetical protein